MKGGLLQPYKEWVRRHPGMVQNFDWLLSLAVWSPGRTSGGSEFTYEAYHAAIGLLSLWHQSILEEGELPTSRPAPYLWLDALEHVETLIELRGIRLEERGKMSRYAPLLAVELARAVLKMAAWGRYSGHLFLRRPGPDDLHQFESEQGLQDILASLERLRQRYTAAPQGCDGTAAAPAAASSSAASAAPRAGAGEACCGVATTSGGGCSYSTYGIRQYLDEHLCCLFSATRSGGDGGGGGAGGQGGCSGGGGEQGRGAGAEADWEDVWAQTQQQAAARCGSGAAASTSPRCRTGAAAAAAGGGDPWFTGAGWDLPTSKPHHSTAQHCDRVTVAAEARAGVGGGAASAAAAALAGVRAEWARVCASRAAEDPDAVMGRNLVWLGELLAIWRPVIYVSLLKRYGRRSWRPWLVSLSADLLSGHFHRRGAQHLAAAEARKAAAAAGAAGPAKAAGAAEPGSAEAEAAKAAAAAGPAGAAAVAAAARGAGTSLLSLALARSLASPGLTPGEERELYERRRKLMLYGLRSPFLDTVTMSVLSRVRSATRRIPLLGLGSDYVYGLVETFTAYYSYTNGSN